MKLERQLQSPLVRWVQRHGNMTMLFRSSRSADAPRAPSSFGPPPMLSTPRPDVQPAAALGDAPAVEVVPSPAAVPSVRAAVIRPPAARETSIPATPVRRPAVPASPAAPREQADASAGRAAAQDANWRRLQTILRKHQEQEAANPAQAEPPVEPAPTRPMASAAEQRAESSRTASTLQRRADTSAPAPSPVIEMPPSPVAQTKPPEGVKPAEPMRQQVDQSVAEPQAPISHLSGLADLTGVEQHAAPVENAPASFARPGESRHTPIHAAQFAAQFAAQGAAQSAAPDAPQPAAPATRRTGEPTLIAPVQPVARRDEGQASAAPGKRPLDLTMPSTATPSPDRELDAPQPPAQPVPLQAVWPTQRMDMPAQRPLDPVLAPEPVIESGAEFEPVEQRLKAVSTGQPTDSPVEIVPPRRARPTVAPRPVAVEQPAQPVHPAAQTAVLRQVEPTARESAETQLVPTEIGPLPADLWRLVGQTPPVQEQPMSKLPRLSSGAPTGTTLDEHEQIGHAVEAKAEPSGIRTVTASAPAVASVMRTPSTPSPAVATAAASRTRSEQAPAVMPTLVQREADTSAAPAAEASASSATTEAEDETSGAGKEMNLDELVRQVYAQVRQRIARHLGIEWERGRGRF